MDKPLKNTVAITDLYPTTAAPDPVTKGWLAALATAYHLMKKEGHVHEAGKINEVLHHHAQPDAAAVLPAIVVEMDGGVINCVRSNVAAQVTILDADTEGGAPIHTVLGSEFYVTEHSLTRYKGDGHSGVDPDYVNQVTQQLRAQDDSEVVRFYAHISAYITNGGQQLRELVEKAESSDEASYDNFRWAIGVDAIRHLTDEDPAGSEHDEADTTEQISNVEEWVANNVSGASAQIVIAASFVLHGAEHTARLVNALPLDAAHESPAP